VFWIALSAFIMSLTGSGDDTFLIRKFLERTRDGVEEEVRDAGRRQKALKTVDRLEMAFARHRKRVGRIAECVEKADRKYAVTAADYDRCRTDAKAAWDAAAKDLTVLDRELRSTLTPAELEAVRRRALE
jgi:hypothetical protein